MTSYKIPAVRYVLGFVFNHDASKVLLIQKNRPAWQAGKFNGLGGKIEGQESPLLAMVREFREETGFVSVSYDGGATVSTGPTWQYAGKRFRQPMIDKEKGSYEMYVFGAIYDDINLFDSALRVKDPTAEVKRQAFLESEATREHLIVLPLNREILSRRGVPGLAWTVDITLQSLQEGFVFSVEDPSMASK